MQQSPHKAGFVLLRLVGRGNLKRKYRILFLVGIPIGTSPHQIEWCGKPSILETETLPSAYLLPLELAPWPEGS
ncbi:hypothetical protein GC387_09190 [Pseudomonas sp. MWU12-2323]|nr:hypothetical protein [Pseudomonas sp. MWU12-2323]